MIAPRTSAGRRRSIRIRAALAAGLVVGVSASMTLAAWTDAEKVSSSFGSGLFGVQSKTAGEADYGEHATSGAAGTLTLSASRIYPGTMASPWLGAVYGQVQVRTVASSIAGTVTIAAPTVSPTGAGTLGASLQYRIVRTTAACEAAAFTAAAVTAGTSVFVVGNATTARPLTLGQEAGVTTVLAANQAAPVLLCAELSLPSTAPIALAGLSATVTWRLGGQSS